MRHVVAAIEIVIDEDLPVTVEQIVSAARTSEVVQGSRVQSVQQDLCLTILSAMDRPVRVLPATSVAIRRSELGQARLPSSRNSPHRRILAYG